MSKPLSPCSPTGQLTVLRSTEYTLSDVAPRDAIDPRTVTAVCVWLRQVADDLRSRRDSQVPAPCGSRWPWIVNSDGASAVVDDIADQLAGLSPAELEQLISGQP